VDGDSSIIGLGSKIRASRHLGASRAQEPMRVPIGPEQVAASQSRASMALPPDIVRRVGPAEFGVCDGGADHPARAAQAHSEDARDADVRYICAGPKFGAAA
jgi:hypothetical protein